ncbi:MAG: FtsX-like permease family protein [Bryobacteraceae bacterium]
MGGPFRSSYEIVVVVKDARYFGLRSATEPMMFIPVWREFAEQRALVIRTAGSASQLTALQRRKTHELDPVIPLLNIHTLEQDVDQSILVERLVATLSGFFGLLALLLSAVGLYGVVAYTVTRRTREIGIRMAIGAGRGSVLSIVFGDVILMVIIGALIGTAAAFMTTRAVAGMLYGVEAADPLSMIAAGLCLVVTAILASVLPAPRAAKKLIQW